MRKSRACHHCEFWSGFSDKQSGHCRRYPPIVQQDNIYREAVIPITKAGDWCGEFIAAVL